MTVVPSVRAKSVPYIDVSHIKGYYYTEVVLYHIISSISVKWVGTVDDYLIGI